MGFAAGFQVGASAVERGLKMREENELKRGLAQAYAKPETSQGYTAETGQQLEELAKTGAYDIVPQYAPAAEGQTQGVFTGYQAVPKAGLDLQGDMPAAPMSFNPQQVQDYGGRRVAGQFDPMQLQGLQMREAARVIGASGDPVRAAQMMAEATRMEREAVESPLRLEALRTQVAAGKLGLTKTEQDIESGTFTLAEKKRLAQDAERMNNFNVAFGEASAKAQEEGRTLGPRDIADLAKANKLNYSQENELIASQVNRTKAEVDQFRLDVEKLTQGKSYDQLIDLHKNDKRFGDGMHFVSEVDKKTGKHILARVNEATGQVEERLPFKSKAEATAYLMEEARNPANAAIWLQNYQKGAAGIAAQEASAQKDKALAGLYNQGGAGAGKGGLKQKVADFKEVYGRDPTEAERNVLANLVAKDPNKPEFTPKDYALTVESFVKSGFSQADALIKADKLYGRGPADANVDAGLQKANAAKGGPATPAKPAVGLTPQQMEKAAPAQQPTRAPTTLDAIQSANLEAVSPLAAQFKQARAQLIQASQSKDPNAIAYYINQQNALRQQLESEVARRFGNNAQTVMQQLAGGL